MNQVNYLCERWQFFLQQIMVYVSTGHYFYHFYRHDAKRRDKLVNMDTKIIERFELELSKDQRYRRKKKGMANYAYLRCDLSLIIMKTQGDEPLNERQVQKFNDVRTCPLEIPVGIELALKLCKEQETKATDSRKAKQGFTYYLTRQCFRNIKAQMLDNVEHGRIDALKWQFEALNRIPAYSGIVKHKKLLLEAVLKAARKHGMKFKKADFPLITRL